MYLLLKRLFDLTLAGTTILVLAPLLIPIMVGLKLTGEGHVWYKQERIGLKNKPFLIWKFATMLKNSPNIGSGEITIQNDPRVLPFGKLLRKTKVNELPQIWNILMGDMSIVGPRPMVLNTYTYYSEDSRLKLNTVRPGLTGIGSIVFRDEESFLANRNEPMEFYRDQIIPYKSELELWFIENFTLWLYLKIIFVTAWVVFFPSSQIVDKAFIGLPRLPKKLKM